MSPLANMLVQIKNAQAIGRQEVFVPFSQMKLSIASVLQREGYIAQVEKKQKKMKRAEVPILSLMLKYENGQGRINGLRLVSKPSRRMYAPKDSLQKVQNGFGISVISTSKGIMTGSEARKTGIGGEVLFEIW